MSNHDEYGRRAEWAPAIGELRNPDPVPVNFGPSPWCEKCGWKQDSEEHHEFCRDNEEECLRCGEWNTLDVKGRCFACRPVTP